MLRVLGAATSKTRADIGITLPDGSVTLLDTSIAKPTATVIEKAGSAADNRVKEKSEKYEKNWKLHQGTKILIACIEAGGRWHPDLSNFIKRYIKASCGDDIKTYEYKLKATKQRVSVALRRSTSRAIMEMQRRAKAYPVVAVDAAA